MPWDHSPAKRQADARNYGTNYRRQRQAALNRDRHRCVTCGATRDLQVDHIVPVSQGGTEDLTNLRTLCGRCHRSKTANEGGGYRSVVPADPAPRPGTQW